MKFNSLQQDNLISEFEERCSEVRYQLKDNEPKDYYIEYYIFQGELRKFLNQTVKEGKQWNVVMYVTLSVIFFLIGMVIGSILILWTLNSN